VQLSRLASRGRHKPIMNNIEKLLVPADKRRAFRPVRDIRFGFESLQRRLKQIDPSLDRGVGVMQNK
jgi:hypothetical protein